MTPYSSIIQNIIKTYYDLTSSYNLIYDPFLTFNIAMKPTYIMQFVDSAKWKFKNVLWKLNNTALNLNIIYFFKKEGNLILLQNNDFKK